MYLCIPFREVEANFHKAIAVYRGGRFSSTVYVLFVSGVENSVEWCGN